MHIAKVHHGKSSHLGFLTDLMFSMREIAVASKRASATEPCMAQRGLPHATTGIKSGLSLQLPIFNILDV